ncbi:MAG: hypothetical protein WCX65_02120 [bacterium]
MWNDVMTFLKLEKIQEINARYRKGSVELRRPARVILFMLRIYLVIMVALLIIKFAQILMGRAI